MRVEKNLPSALIGLSFLSVLSSILTFLFMGISSRSLGTENFGEFTVAWSIVYTIAGSILAAAEPELTRLMISQRFCLVKRVMRWVITLLLTLPVVLFGLSLADIGAVEFGGVLTLLIILLLLAMFAEVVSRSIMASKAQRARYGVVAPTDAALRVVFLAILTVMLTRLSVNWVFVAMILGSATVGISAMVAVSSSLRLLFRGSSAVLSRDFSPPSGYGYLLAGSVALTFLLSGVPFIVGFTSAISAEELGLIGATLLVARVPLIFVMGFESVLVQEFAARLAANESIEKITMLLLTVVLIITSGAFLFGFFIGPQVVGVITGSGLRISSGDMSLFSGASGMLLGGILLTPLCIALNRHRHIAFSWVFSFLAFLVLNLVWSGGTTSIAILLLVASVSCVSSLSISALTAHRQRVENL